MYCLTCDAEKHPVTSFTANGLVDACPACQTVFRRHGDPQDAAPAVAAPTPPAPVKQPASGDALSIVDQMRARLAKVEAEIAARDGFLAERDLLRKMLAAADGETRPTASVFTN